MARVLLLMPSTSYRASDFLKAGARLGVEVVVGSNHRPILEQFSEGRTLMLHFDRLDESVTKIVEQAARRPLDGIVGVDEETLLLAARASAKLGLPHNSEHAVADSHNKHRLRQVLEQTGLKTPWYKLIDAHDDLERLAEELDFPCVLKPLTLSASRGVIRADNPNAFTNAGHRIRKMLENSRFPTQLLVEQFIPGNEVALEGLLANGQLKVLSLFDKPDPLNGPFFEETLYVTPSRLADRTQHAVREECQLAARALGLHSGPVHAELRINNNGPWLIELGARTIGGLCSRSLCFTGQHTLEELVIRQVLGEPEQDYGPAVDASGVMMIPIPTAGRLRAIVGLDKARQVPGITDVVVTIPLGETLVPLPEGARYLGFIFCKAKRAQDVESALRQAHRQLAFVIE